MEFGLEATNAGSVITDSVHHVAIGLPTELCLSQQNGPPSRFPSPVTRSANLVPYQSSVLLIMKSPKGKVGQGKDEIDFSSLLVQV